ncbi:hypothetical protein [Deinococcus sp.]|uniref:hypothetical protein n=1 Tax=Deinococcus sp. TaxID=47478 RepID=UPI003CC69F2C
MKRKTLPLVTLLLVFSLASCAPTVQGLNGEIYRPQTQSGFGTLFVERVPLSEVTATTPETMYVQIPGCVNSVISVADVRKLGADVALQACQGTDLSIVGAVAGSAVISGLLFTLLFASLSHSLTSPNK